MLNAGNPEQLVCQIAGWRSGNMIRQYYHKDGLRAVKNVVFASEKPDTLHHFNHKTLLHWLKLWVGNKLTDTKLFLYSFQSKDFKMTNTIAPEIIENRIVIIRGVKVMIDHDLAMLYDVPTKVLNQAIKRNAGRFPEDFVFRLSKEEKNELVTNCDRFTKVKSCDF